MTLYDVMQKLSSDSASWKRIQSEIAAASDKRARFVELAKEQGLTFDAAELDAIAAAVAAGSKGELNESQLQSISGGLNFTNIQSTYFKYDDQQKVLIGLIAPSPTVKLMF
jgi:hypothetical protein